MSTSPRARAGVGLRIKERREQLGWTVRELARRSNVSPATVSRAERHCQVIGYANVIKLATALSVSLAFLTDAPPPQGRSLSDVNDALYRAMDALFAASDRAHSAWLDWRQAYAGATDADD